MYHPFSDAQRSCNLGGLGLKSLARNEEIASSATCSEKKAFAFEITGNFVAVRVEVSKHLFFRDGGAD